MDWKLVACLWLWLNAAITAVWLALRALVRIRGEEARALNKALDWLEMRENTAGRYAANQREARQEMIDKRYGPDAIRPEYTAPMVARARAQMEKRRGEKE